MKTRPIPMSAFARFYEASPLNKVTRVRNALLMAVDPEGYKVRDYYLDLRNTLSETHWRTGDILSFEEALDALVEEQEDSRKKGHYLAAGRAYIDFWKKQDARYFCVPSSEVEIAGLPVEVTTEVGMRCREGSFALKLWFNAGKPTRQFRQAVQFMTCMGRDGSWREEWQPAVWDVRRQAVLPPIPIPKEFGLALEGQSAAFQRIWGRLEEEGM
ncbi:MAG: hypothetical protein FJ320_12205 [SAR202 cluster bacterium]|nr:hypothetical protein [SAR202 cluster bacterium]